VAGFALHDFVRDLDFGVQVNAFPAWIERRWSTCWREVHYDEQEEEIEDFGKPGNQLDKA
jgi:hypothetical protein